MKTLFLLFIISLPLFSQSKDQKDVNLFSDYLLSFDYEERKEMKISIDTLLKLIEKTEVQIIDVRFPEEVSAWSFGFIQSIPLNELPKRLDELDKNKIIVTACPHSDRAALARHYLTLNGFKSKYLVEGLLGLAEYLRGDKAADFIRNNK